VAPLVCAAVRLERCVCGQADDDCFTHCAMPGYGTRESYPERSGIPIAAMMAAVDCIEKNLRF
jgi:hypothetical protein